MENALNADFLEAIRLSELTQIETILKNTVPAGAKILEIGAGTGWQARELAARGYEVSAIDIPTSNHGQARIWPIIDFDGRFIPFPDKSFDIVYSSNVLEHVEDIKTLNTEIARVLRIGGTAIHYVPTSAWRAWSLAAFYPALLRDGLRRMRTNLASSRADGAAPVVSRHRLLRPANDRCWQKSFAASCRMPMARWAPAFPSCRDSTDGHGTIFSPPRVGQLRPTPLTDCS